MSKVNFFTVTKKLRKNILNFISTEIEWKPINNVNVSRDKLSQMNEFLDALDNDEDVKNIFTNLKIETN